MNTVNGKRGSFLLAGLLSLGLLAIAPSADAATATEVVKARQATLFQLLGQPSAANEKKIGALFDEMLDDGALAEASLGSEWNKRTDAEKAEFTEVLKGLVRKAYERNIKKTLGYQIDYVGEDAGKAGSTVVKTRAKPKAKSKEEPVSIEYKMVDKNGSWRIVDIVTEEVSLVSSYRAQFTKIIKKDGFPVLIKKMKDKLAKGDAK